MSNSNMPKYPFYNFQKRKIIEYCNKLPPQEQLIYLRYVLGKHLEYGTCLFPFGINGPLLTFSNPALASKSTWHQSAPSEFKDWIENEIKLRSEHLQVSTSGITGDDEARCQTIDSPTAPGGQESGAQAAPGTRGAVMSGPQGGDELITIAQAVADYEVSDDFVQKILYGKETRDKFLPAKKEVRPNAKGAIKSQRVFSRAAFVKAAKLEYIETRRKRGA